MAANEHSVPEDTGTFFAQCNTCQRRFKSKEHYSKHRRGALCRRLVQKVARKQRKMKSKHDGINIISEKTEEKSKLKRKSSMYQMYKPYQCGVCTARFYDKVNVELHLEREHSTNQQLWTEVSKATISNSSVPYTTVTNSFPNNGTTSEMPNCDINNGSQFYNGGKFKCLDCNLQFSSDNDLAQHRRLNHNVPVELNPVPNCNLDQARNINNQFSATSTPSGSSQVDSSNSIQNKGLPLTNMNVSNIVQPQSSYVFPQNYYNNINNNNEAPPLHLQQNLINPNQQLYHTVGPQTAIPNTHHHSPNVLPQQPLLLHHHQADPNTVQQQYTFHNMAGPSVSHTNNTDSTTTQFIVMNPHESSIQPRNTAPVTEQTVAISSTSSASHNVSKSIPGNCSNQLTNELSNSKSKLTASSNATSKPNANQYHSSPGATSNSNKWNMCGECNVKFLDLMNLEVHVERKHPDLSIIGSIVLDEETVCYKTGTVSMKKNRSISSKDLTKEQNVIYKHSCILCNHVSNSLHSIVDHVTNVHFLEGKSMINSIISTGSSSESSEKAIYPKASKEVEVNRLKRIESSTKTVKGVAENVDTIHQCHSCLQSFNTASEVIRHSIKDKKHTCVVCCFVTCSKQELFDHVKSEHQNWNDFKNLTIEDTQSDTEERWPACFLCKKKYKKTSELILHLQSHGTLTAKCVKCGKQDYNAATILLHMTTLHPHYMNKVKITVVTKGKAVSSVYMQTVSGDLIDMVQMVSKNSKNKLAVLKGVDGGVSQLFSVSNKQTNTPPYKSATTCHQIYACSECCVCFYSTTSIECHFKKHATSNKKSLNAAKIATKAVGSSTSRIGLKVLPNTKSFRCAPCGFISESDSDVVVRHIRDTHLSAVMVHCVKSEADTLEEYKIMVVSPVS